MCFYMQVQWKCGFWKWGTFTDQCPREWRTGETCGLKFVKDVQLLDKHCLLCEKIDKKERRRRKLEQDIARWSQVSNRSASIEKALRDKAEIEDALHSMRQTHLTRQYSEI